MLVLYAAWRGRSDVSGLTQGFGVLLVLLLTWSAYKALVLPSADPLMKFALSGDYGFNTSQSAWSMIKARYLELGFSGWLEVKKALSMQLFVPVDRTIAAFGLNSDFGATTLDRLRAYDFAMLSRGNIALPVAAALGLVAARGRSSARENAPFSALFACSSLAWILVVFFSLAPAVLHHLPYATVFGAALGGAVLLARFSPRIFLVLLLLLAGYTGAVWGAMPLVNALGCDVFAAALLAMGGGVFLFFWGSHIDKSRK